MKLSVVKMSEIVDDVSSSSQLQNISVSIENVENPLEFVDVRMDTFSEDEEICYDSDGFDKNVRKNEQGEFVCTKCPFTTTSSNGYKTHIKLCKQKHQRTKSRKCKKPAIVEPDLFECDFCTSTFTSREDFQAHKKTHRKDDTFKCKVCLKEFRQSKTLTRHLRTHSGEKPFVCTVCNKAFNQSCNLVSHMRTHFDDKRHKCPICSRELKYLSSLNYHMKIIHKVSEEIKPDDAASILTNYLDSLGSDNIYNCKDCTKTFSSLTDLIKHEKTHTEDNWFVCELCNKTFKTITGLSYHMRNHSDDTPYKCNVCGKSFKHSRTLSCHSKTHSGEKKYKCTVCTKAFADSSNLVRHMRTHSDKKEYKCKICNKKLQYENSLTYHMKTHEDVIVK